MMDLTTEYGQRCIVVDDEQSLHGMVRYLRQKQAEGALIGFDTEATGTLPERARLVGMSFAASRKAGFYIPVGHVFGQQLELQPVLDAIRPIVEGPGITCQGGKYDIRMMRKYGVEVALASDSQSLTRLTGEVEHGIGLKPSVKRMYDEEVTEYTDVVGPGQTFADVEITEAAKYAVPDAINCLRLTLDAEIPVPDMLRDTEIEMMRMAADMEDHGVPIDPEYVREQIEIGRAMAKLLEEEAIAALATLAQRRGNRLPPQLNLNSSKQLQHVLFELCGLPVIKRSKKTGNPSAAKDVLERLAKTHGPVDKIARFRSCESAIERLEGFVEWAVEEPPRPGWWLHAGLRPTGTATGRWSSGDPVNLQNIPKKGKPYVAGQHTWEFQPRNAITAPEGFYIVSADYSQIELRVATGESGCAAWHKAFRERLDIHRVTAAAAYGIPFESVTNRQRDDGKTLNFTMLYGAEADTIADRIEGGGDKEEAERLRQAFWAGLPEVRAWADSVEAGCRKRHYVETHFGRRRWLRDVADHKAWVRRKALREAVNTVVQGTAADILKIGMRRQRPVEKRLGTPLMLVVHDQYVWLVPVSMSPREFCLTMDPVINFQISGYPEIISDYGIGQRLGSLTYYDPEDVPDRLDDVRERQAAERVTTIVLRLDREITRREWSALSRLVERHPGDNRLRLECGQGTVGIPATTGLGLADALLLQAEVAGLELVAEA